MVPYPTLLLGSYEGEHKAVLFTTLFKTQIVWKWDLNEWVSLWTMWVKTF